MYQDGRQVQVLRDIVDMNFGGNDFFITGIKPGHHQFRFKVIDKGGNTVDSKPLDIEGGRYSQPKIERIN